MVQARTLLLCPCFQMVDSSALAHDIGVSVSKELRDEALSTLKYNYVPGHCQLAVQDLQEELNVLYKYCQIRKKHDAVPVQAEHAETGQPLIYAMDHKFARLKTGPMLTASPG